MLGIGVEDVWTQIGNNYYPHLLSTIMFDTMFQNIEKFDTPQLDQ